MLNIETQRAVRQWEEVNANDITRTYTKLMYELRGIILIVVLLKYGV